MPPQAATPGPRARYREQTRAEIKAAALAQLAEGGTGALALVKIAKELGLSGPALYRYFAGRDDLLDALICDAYADLAGAVADAAATSAGAGSTPRSRLRDLVRTFRGWAVAQPHRYLLIGGTPVPGYEAPPQTREHARAVLGPFVALLAGCTPHPALGPVVADLRAWVTREPGVERWLETYLPEASAEAAAAGLTGAVQVWTQVHGTVSLEVSGLYNGMGHDPAALLDAQVELLADALSLA
ncbi:TetR/AcrR family transcriptional regulator [Streptomyces sp. NPDC088194]|uniref:TetR/AcrR family transcriptional regulator n=1 Tax=Streptomyces sp. NPDC088194 TaxID=3154931 RepID=UPI00344BE547